MNILLQAYIAFTGFIAIFMINSLRRDVRKWACVFGLAGQPAWFYTTYMNGQWGMFFLTFGFITVWAISWYNYWIKEEV